MAEARKRCPAHFNGSVPLGEVETVLRTISSALGDRTLRLPDGEVGAKQGWINTQQRVFERHPAFEAYEADADWRTPGQRRRRFRLKQGASEPGDLGPLGYSEWARQDYQVFARLKREGAIPKAARLKIAIPAPYDSLNYALDHEIIPIIAPAYERSLVAEVAAIGQTIPADELAIQWDAAHEFEALATGDPVFFPMSREEIVRLLARLGDSVPKDVELGYHCCYGNYDLRHFVEPADTADMVEVINAVAPRLGRPINFIHMPVPIARSDDGYFSPLGKFRPGPETQLFLGLIHDKDGTEGALKRAAAARRHIGEFGVATECGLGGRTPENVRGLVRLHADVAAALDRTG
jgi:methionine synthase II (cobalamin-independent)